jgi:hypothetical protein
MKWKKLEKDVKEVLKRRGETLSGASLKMGFSKNFLGQMLNGTTNINNKNFVKICKAFKLNPTKYTDDGTFPIDFYLPRKGVITNAETNHEIPQFQQTTDVFEIVVDETFQCDMFGKNNVFEPGCAFRVVGVDKIKDHAKYLVSSGGKFVLKKGEEIPAKGYKYVYEIVSVRGPK